MPSSSRIVAASRMVGQSDWLPMMIPTGFAAALSMARSPFAPRPNATGCIMQSGDNVRGQFVLKPGNAVLERELLLFQPLQGQRMGQALAGQRRDRLVQIPMFAPQHFQPGAGDLFGGHLVLGVHVVPRAGLMRL